jgi:hypothetical protein
MQMHKLQIIESKSFIMHAQAVNWQTNGATTFSTTTLSITAFSITTLSMKGLFLTLNINDTQYKDTLYTMPLC